MVPTDTRSEALLVPVTRRLPLAGVSRSPSGPDAVHRTVWPVKSTSWATTVKVTADPPRSRASSPGVPYPAAGDA